MVFRVFIVLEEILKSLSFLGTDLDLILKHGLLLLLSLEELAILLFDVPDGLVSERRRNLLPSCHALGELESRADRAFKWHVLLSVLLVDLDEVLLGEGLLGNGSGLVLKGAAVSEVGERSLDLGLLHRVVQLLVPF